MIRFTVADVDRANDAWGCNCGPSSFAAILGLTLDETRRHFGPEFEAKRYTNPTLMVTALRSALGAPGARWRQLRLVPDRIIGESYKVPAAAHIAVAWPRWGLLRVQWEGPWTRPGVPIAARYRKTHWVGVARRGDEIGVFDVNVLSNGSGWCSLGDWSSKVVPWILESYPAATGGWHVTHAIEVERPTTRSAA